MTSFLPIKLVRVKKTGEKYIYNGMIGEKIRCRGSVIRRSGLSTVHLPDRVFLKEAVEILEIDLTEQLVQELT